MKPLVSVIIPVYKVEGCLSFCLESLVRQSLRDIEILLIDDASPDKCGVICEAYAARDERFRVFHNVTNKGLSAARNVGIANAHCDFLMFVDSDDWVHEDFCKVPYECAIHYHADIVMFNYQRVKEDKVYYTGHKTIKSGYKSREDAIGLLIKNTAAWNKLYRKELFNGVCFPEGKLFEDAGTTYKLFLEATNIYYLENVLYYYRFRPDSITKQKNERTLRDWIEMNMQLYRGLLEKEFPSENLNMFLEMIALEYCMKKKPDDTDIYYTFCANVLLSSNSKPENLTCKQNLLFFLFKYCRPLFELICNLYNIKVY